MLALIVASSVLLPTQSIAPPDALGQTPNLLTPAEKKAGWELLFDGKTFAGWHNYRSKDVNSGWVIKDGAMRCQNPAEAGDLLTEDTYRWFELDIEFNMDKGQNSGIMFHVDESEQYPWMTGPEVQIYDHPLKEGVETTGCLYQFYRPTKDAAKPAGEWNRLQLHLTKEIAWVKLNGVKLYDFVLNGEDWNARLAKSKFAKMPNFGKLTKGSIAIQGDHGVVSFRNIKIRQIPGAAK